jgi:hypothetical protein
MIKMRVKASQYKHFRNLGIKVGVIKAKQDKRFNPDV